MTETKQKVAVSKNWTKAEREKVAALIKVDILENDQNEVFERMNPPNPPFPHNHQKFQEVRAGLRHLIDMLLEYSAEQLEAHRLYFSDYIE